MARPSSASRPDALDGIIDELDWGRLRMGRFSEADEHMMRRLVEGGSERAFLRLLGGGIDVTRQAHHSSRPAMPPLQRSDGGREPPGHTFSFGHRMLTVRHRPGLSRSRVYVEGTADALRESAARFDRNVVSSNGSRGAWYVGPASPLAPGVRYSTGVSARPRGLGVGAARRFQAYIERDGAAVYGIGTLGDTKQDRMAFWDRLESLERAGGRIQGRVIAELPADPAVGAEGRENILRRFGLAVFEKLDLPWYGVIHDPDRHSDARNFHAHLLYSDRPFDGQGRLGNRKSAETRRIDFIPKLRAAWAEAVNEEFRLRGLTRRFDPRSYVEAGLDKLPGEHLGPAAAALERRGIATVAGSKTAGAEIAWRLTQASRREERQAATIASRYAPVAEALRADAMDVGKAGGRQALRAAAVFAETANAALAADRALLVATILREVASGRAADFVRRLRRAEQSGPLPLRPVSHDARVRVEAFGREEIRRAADAERQARHDLRDQLEKLNRAGRLVTAEQLVFQLTGAQANLRATEALVVGRKGVKSGPAPRGRVAPGDWDARVETQRSIVEAAGKGEEKARADLLKATRSAFGRGPKAEEWFAGLDNDATRLNLMDTLSAMAKGASPKRATLIDACREASLSLDRAVQHRMVELGRLRRLERQTPVSRRGEDEQLQLEKRLTAAREDYERALVSLRGNALAFEIAVKRGIVEKRRNAVTAEKGRQD